MRDGRQWAEFQAPGAERRFIHAKRDDPAARSSIRLLRSRCTKMFGALQKNIRHPVSGIA
jgi:hypothetical protein